MHRFTDSEFEELIQAVCTELLQKLVDVREPAHASHFMRRLCLPLTESNGQR